MRPACTIAEASGAPADISHGWSVFVIKLKGDAGGARIGMSGVTGGERVNRRQRRQRPTERQRE